MKNLVDSSVANVWVACRARTPSFPGYTLCYDYKHYRRVLVVLAIDEYGGRLTTLCLWKARELCIDGLTPNYADSPLVAKTLC